MVDNTDWRIWKFAHRGKPATARGLMKRCDIAILLAMPVSAQKRVSAQKPLTASEIAIVASWPSVAAAGRNVSATHPGRGKALIKIGLHNEPTSGVARPHNVSS